MADFSTLNGNVFLNTDPSAPTSDLRVARTDAGTTSPLAQISMFGAGANSLQGVLSFQTMSSGSGSGPLIERMRIHTNGNVGIGVIGPVEKLEVGGNIRAAAFQGDGSALTGVKDSTKVAKSGDVMTGSLTLPANGLTVGSNQLVVNNGNVGIGTDPENTEGWNKVLDVLGTGNTKLSVRTAQIEARIMTHGSGWWGAPAGMIIGTNTSHPLSFGTARQTRMTIAADGTVNMRGNLEVSGNLISIHYGNRGKFGQATSFNPDKDHNGLWIEGTSPETGNESAGIFLNGDTMCLWSPGDNDILRVYDEDELTNSNPQPKFRIDRGGNVTVAGNLTVTGQLSALNVADNFTAVVGAADFKLGHSSRRGSPGRALVDMSDTLQINYGTDWRNGCRYWGSMDKVSSIRFKKNVADLTEPEATEMLSGLRPVKFNYRKGDTETQHLGFIAEEVPALIASSDREAVSHDHIVTVLTKVVQQQQSTIASLVERLERLEPALKPSGGTV